ncbi:hypothetical protein EOA79_32530, partial [Mesorhizobium sp. M1A.F.Ca.IN.020.03.2.1]|uniref:pantoate--beta-alanine ligase n=1 Tax=Mesorhizobium sp. M1A.F.Ca.IN.020.03.2.1 TaxID=2496769 RepID=UPI000FD4B942
LDIPITIVPCPTVREADGLALSSRNVRLSPAQRAIAPKLASVVGLTPQAVNTFGGYRVQGRGADAERIRRDARAVTEAGGFSLV